MQILSLNVGKPEKHQYQGKEYKSAIFKKPVSEAIMLHEMGFDGDEVADKKHHGGPDQAVCFYSYTHYPYWKEVLERELDVPAFGENITVPGWVEEAVCIGDIFRLGEAVVQVTIPRQPCYTVVQRQGWKEAITLMLDTGYMGYYLRVLQEGIVAPNAEMIRIEQDSQQMTVAEAARIMFFHNKDREQMQRLHAIETLAEHWRTRITQKLAEM